MEGVHWFSLDQVRAASDWSDHAYPGELQLPGEVSIARGMIDAWVERGGCRP